MTHFTEEEKNLIGIYNSGGRLFTAANMENALPFVDDSGIDKMMRSVIRRLLKMTDKEFRMVSGSMIE